MIKFTEEEKKEISKDKNYEIFFRPKIKFNLIKFFINVIRGINYEK